MDVDVMHKRIDVHLPLDLYKELKNQPQTITQTVTQALTQYLHNDTQAFTYEYNADYVNHLLEEIQYLRQLHRDTMDRVLYLPTPKNENNDFKAHIAQEHSPARKNRDNAPECFKTTFKAKEIENHIDKVIQSKGKSEKRGFWARFGF